MLVCCVSIEMPQQGDPHQSATIDYFQSAILASTLNANSFLERDSLVHRLIYTGDVVAFKMGRRQGGPSRTGGRRAHI
jgi:hypothetical protein